MISRITNFFLGEPHPLKFSVGQTVSYPAENLHAMTESGNDNIVGTITQIEQGRGEVPNYYWVVSLDLLHIDRKPLPIGVCEEKITLITNENL